MDKVKILGIAGSLRKGSYNKMLLREAVAMSPLDAEITTFDIEGIPPFNQDFELCPDQKVVEFKEAVRSSDALLFVTPEYNYSIPGVLKNAIDSASRPYGDNPFDGKPVGLMGASVGMMGSGRAQYHLRQCCVFLNMFPVNQPEVMVPFAEKAFSADGRLIDEEARIFVKQLLDALVEWTRRLSSPT